MCIKESGVYVVKKVWNDGESLLHVIKTTVLVVQNKSERRTTHFSTHMCLFLTIFWIKRLRFGCFTYRQYSRYYHHLDTRLHVYTMHRIFPSFFGISPLLTFMYVSKFVWSLIASSIDYAADGRLFLDENEPWMFFWNILVFLSFYIYHSYERVNRLMMVCSIVIVDYRKSYIQKMSDFVSGIQWMLLKLLYDGIQLWYYEK